MASVPDPWELQQEFLMRQLTQLQDYMARLRLAIATVEDALRSARATGDWAGYRQLLQERQQYLQELRSAMARYNQLRQELFRITRLRAGRYYGQFP